MENRYYDKVDSEEIIEKLNIILKKIKEKNQLFHNEKNISNPPKN